MRLGITGGGHAGACAGARLPWVRGPGGQPPPLRRLLQRLADSARHNLRRALAQAPAYQSLVSSPAPALTRQQCVEERTAIAVTSATRLLPEGAIARRHRWHREGQVVQMVKRAPPADRNERTRMRDRTRAPLGRRRCALPGPRRAHMRAREGVPGGTVGGMHRRRTNTHQKSFSGAPAASAADRTFRSARQSSSVT